MSLILLLLLSINVENESINQKADKYGNYGKDTSEIFRG
jgi:hypothetical protein